jgi:hypothetical protein
MNDWKCSANCNTANTAFSLFMSQTQNPPSAFINQNTYRMKIFSSANHGIYECGPDQMLAKPDLFVTPLLNLVIA